MRGEGRDGVDVRWPGHRGRRGGGPGAVTVPASWVDVERGLRTPTAGRGCDHLVVVDGHLSGEELVALVDGVAELAAVVCDRLVRGLLPTKGHGDRRARLPAGAGHHEHAVHVAVVLVHDQLRCCARPTRRWSRRVAMPPVRVP